MCLMLVLRLTMAILGGYFLTVAIGSLVAVSLPRLMPLARDEAVLAAVMVAFLLYAAVLMWALLEPRFARMSCIIVGGACVAQWLAQSIAG